MNPLTRLAEDAARVLEKAGAGLYRLEVDEKVFIAVQVPAARDLATQALRAAQRHPRAREVVVYKVVALPPSPDDAPTLEPVATFRDLEGS